MCRLPGAGGEGEGEAEAEGEALPFYDWTNVQGEALQREGFRRDRTEHRGFPQGVGREAPGGPAVHVRRRRPGNPGLGYLHPFQVNILAGDAGGVGVGTGEWVVVALDAVCTGGSRESQDVAVLARGAVGAQGGRDLASFRSDRALGASDAGGGGVGAGDLVVVAFDAIRAGPSVAGGAAPLPSLAIVAVNQSGDAR